MNKKIWIWAVVIIAVVALGVMFINKHNQNSGDIRLGAILNLTGTFADQGENSQRGIQLALGEINRQGGVLGKQVVMDYQDNGGDNPAGALGAMNTLMGQNIDLIIGPNLTPSANVIAPVAWQRHVMLIAPSVGTEKFANASKGTFNVFPANKFDSYALANYLYSKKKFTKIAIFGSQQEWEMDQANFVKEEFEKLGGTVTSIQLPAVDNTDLRAEALKIKNSNPQAVVFTNYGETAISARRLRDLGINMPFYSVLLFGTQIKNAQGALEGTVFITTDTVNDQFNTKFKATYNKDPAFPASQAYDATYLLIEAIKNAKSTDPRAVAMALAHIKTWHGASGDITFDADGNAHKQDMYYQVKNGQIVAFTQ